MNGQKVRGQGFIFSRIINFRNILQRGIVDGEND